MTAKVHHRYRIGEEVRVIECSPMGFPAPVGTLLTVGMLCGDGWYRTPNGSRFAPHEVEALDPARQPTPTHVTVTHSRWEEIRHQNDEVLALRAQVKALQATVEQVRKLTFNKAYHDRGIRALMVVNQIEIILDQEATQ